MTSSSPGSSTVLERQRVTQGYPQARVIVLDDDVNTFQHVVDCLRKIIPGMSEDKAWSLANTIDSAGSARFGVDHLSRPSSITSNWPPRG